MIAQARKAHPDLTFLRRRHRGRGLRATRCRGPFDVIVVVDTLGALDDCQAMFEHLHALCTRETRLVIGYFSHLWYPALEVGRGGRAEDAAAAAKRPVSRRRARARRARRFRGRSRAKPRLLLPMRLLGLGRLRQPLPGALAAHPLSSVCGTTRSAARCGARRADLKSATIVVPARNERGNIEAAVKRIPRFVDDLEIIFVEGHSQDGTWEEIERVVAAYPRLRHQGDAAARQGQGRRGLRRLRCRARRCADHPRCRSDHAAGAAAEILGGDPLRQGRVRQRLAAGLSDGGAGDAVPQSRRQQESSRCCSPGCCRSASPTRCAAPRRCCRSDYARLKAGRGYFGDFDPFGDFDLIFGASKLGLKAVEIPIRYASRTYGETQISRFRHGFMLLRMVLFAFMRIKAM